MKILFSAAVGGLRILYFFFKLLFRPRKKISFLSRQGDTESVDFLFLQKEIQREGFDGEVKVLCKKIAPGIMGKIGYAFHIILQMYHIATSKVIILDGYNIAVCVLKHKENQKFIQLWHALNIVKKFGFAALDKPWGHKSKTAKFMCMHRNYTHIIACSEASGKALCECFNAEPQKIVLLPLPRIDYILKSPCKDDEIKREYRYIFEKPILLYAPTFRGEQVSLSWIEKTIDLEKYNVVVKLHPADKMGLDSKVDKRIICDQKFTSFDWMKVCDKIVTDYSGMGFEAMLLGKKVYYYLYDYEDYSRNNGLGIDLFSEKISPIVTKTSLELKEVLEKEYDFTLTQAFVEKYLSVGTENCTERLAEFILSLV